jgi:hypothetical protein
MGREIMKRPYWLAIALCAPLSAAHAQQVKPSCTDDSRRCMILAATSYLDGLVHHDGSKVLFAPDIVRTEQGRDAGKGEALLRAKLDKEPPMLGYANTRFTVDRQTHQVVYYTLLRLATDESQPAPPPGVKPLPPVTVHLAERFRVEHGLIEEIEALFYTQSGTADGASGWPDER